MIAARALLLMTIVLTPVIVACADSDDETKQSKSGASATREPRVPDEGEPRTNKAAGDASRRVALYIISGQHGLAYDRLRPAHQRLVTRGQFDACYQQGIDGHTTDLAVTVAAVFDKALDAPGIPERESKEVKLRFSERNPDGDGTSIRLEPGAHSQVYVEGKWRWVLHAGAYRGFQRKRCFLDGEPLTYFSE